MTSNPENNNMFQVPPSTDSSMVSSGPPYPNNQPKSLYPTNQTIPPYNNNQPIPPCPNNQPEVHLYPGYQYQMALPNGNGHIEQKVLNEGKVLGAIQILIGLLHIGFGSVLVTSIFEGHISISFWGGYPYWGGISFIISGTFSVIAQKPPITSYKTKRSLEANIVSTIFSAVGVILLITELSISSGKYYYTEYGFAYYNSGVASGVGISAVLLIFSVLELAISSMCSHAGCQAVCCQTNQVALAVAVPLPGTHMVPPMGIPQPAVNSLVYSSEVNSQQ
ncbi:membrane-spanning 4-domains subfamily A member 8-like [Gracilinanus agilis]|uniref:membrane-spanning 4-domains subfamily A member 8-like n=1 Tax=Gracilinanus agilis TaxID=191870 RepID=UPI001CFEF750|nr:membrane-spanning 4-domains subfamily A member 8-like [Gracilinanus agilis]